MAEAIVQVIFQDRILETVRLDKPVNTAGRLPGNDVVINNLGVSRQHCRITQDENGQFFVEDMGSANGTYINGVRINRSPVYDGDEIQLGKHKLVFQIAKRGVAGFFKSEEDRTSNLWMGDRTIFTGVTPPQMPEPPAEAASPKPAPPPPSPVSETVHVKDFQSELESCEYGLKITFVGDLVGVKGLGEEDITVGRNADNDITLDDPAVSQQHARIFYREGHFVVEDMGSANGTRVNGVIVKGSPLYPGDEITIGKHVLVFETAQRLLAGLTSEDVGREAEEAPRARAQVEPAQKVKEEKAPWEGKYAVRVELDGRAVGTYALTKRVTCIGRLAENDIVIDNIGASRLHAKIVIEENDQCHVEDQDSANGIMVNNLPLKRSPLYPGDTVQISKHKLIFELAHKAQPEMEAAGGKMTMDAWRMDSTFMVSEEEHKQKLKQWAQRAHREKKERAVTPPAATPSETSPEATEPASPPPEPAPEAAPPSSPPPPQPEPQPQPQAPSPEPPKEEAVSPYEETPLPEPKPIKAKLIFPDGDKWEIEKDEFVIGKGKNADLKVSGIWIKKQHAIIRHKGGILWEITDRGRMSRVKVNGKTIRSTVLNNNDEISLGKLLCKFVSS